MNHRAFQLNKVRRAINSYGQLFQFDSPGKNEFGEPNGETVSHEVKGVFHETTQYLTKSTSEASTIRKRSSPMVLMLWEEAKNLHHQDQVRFNNQKYRVSEIKNLGEANLVADISLEEVQV